MKATLKRLREPSTYAGLAAIFAALAPLLRLPPDVVTAGVSVLGGVAVLVREGQPEP